MLDLMARMVEKIVFSGANGKVVIIPLMILIWVMFGQAKDVMREIKKNWEVKQ